MSRAVVVVCVVMLWGAWETRLVFADEAEVTHVSYVVRAWGKHGFARRVHPSAGHAHRRALPRRVNAGVIPRAALQAELRKGPGRFLQQVRVEAVMARGQFVGWRIVKLFPDRSDVHVRVLREGDTILRVNGESVERPEAFKAVWDSMAHASTLALEIMRGRHRSVLRYAIH